jgi:glutamate synthase domain-containing protein 3
MNTALKMERDDWTGHIKYDGGKVVIDAAGLHYKALNEKIRDLINEEGIKDIELRKVNGQRYIGTGIRAKDVTIKIHGTSGNDLAAFMDGPRIEMFGNAQDAVANTMNSGKIIIHGHAGDVLGYGMRGGSLYVQGNVGYRIGIHMKAYGAMVPVIVVGGTAADFFGEYMAGGILVLLGLDKKPEERIVGDWCGTGIHGGVIYIRGEVQKHQLGKEVGVVEKIPQKEMDDLTAILKDYCKEFDLDLKEVLAKPFLKLFPFSTRPYGKLYAY